MNKIQIKSRFNGNVLFEHECENNSTKLTLEAAVKSGADLSDADLSDVNLSNADLFGADLYRADLFGADLFGANLFGANLRGADLSGADLCDVDLDGADLCGANLRDATIADGFVCDGDFHHITNIGSQDGTLELYSCGDAGCYIKRGCFGGSKQEFLDAVAKTHGDNEHGRKYRAIIQLFCGE